MIVPGITSIGVLVAAPPWTTSLPAVGIKQRSIASLSQFASPRMFRFRAGERAMICLPRSAFAPQQSNGSRIDMNLAGHSVTLKRLKTDAQAPPAAGLSDPCTLR